MQFLAFLKDSYREAKSGWMLHVMLVLSALLVLLVFSIGFRPVTLQDELTDMLRLQARFLEGNPKRFAELGSPTFAIENLTASNPNEPWNSDYTFEFVVSCPTRRDMKKANRQGLPVARESVEAYMRGTLSYLNNVEVTGGPPELQKPGEPDEDDEEPKPKEKGKDGAAKEKEKDKEVAKEKKPLPPKEVRYTVTSKGTKAEDRLAWRHQVSILFAYKIPFFYVSLRDGVYVLEKYLVNGAGSWVMLLVAIIITAGFIPTMLAKGSLDLMVSKPIGRTRLLLYKYVGGLTFVFILTTFTVLGVWTAIGARTGLWSANFLAIIPIMMFYFAVLYAVSAAVAVFTRNTLVAILLTGLAWGGLWAVGKVNEGIANRREQEAKARPEAGTAEAIMRDEAEKLPLWGFIPKSAFPVVTALHVVTPRTYQLDDRLGRIIAQGVLTPNGLKSNGYDKPPPASWGEMIGVSLVGIGALLGLAAWRFSSRDY